MSTTGFGGARQHLLDDQIEPFLQDLRDTGYTNIARSEPLLSFCPMGETGKKSPPWTSATVT